MSDFPLITEQEFANLPQNALIFGVNNRLLNTLSKRYAAFQAQKNVTFWTDLTLETPSTWLNQLIEQSQLGILNLPNHKSTLSPDAIHYLWTNIITLDVNLASILPLIDTETLAQTARDAYQLELEWSLPQHTFFPSEEYAHYQKWRDEFNKLCSDNHWSTPILQEIELIQHLSHNPKAYSLWPTTIVWAGFERFSPHLKKLQKLFEHLSIPQFLLNQPHYPKQVSRQAFSHLQEEHRAVAHWAAQCHKDGKRVAWVALNLSQERHSIIDALDQAIRPEYYRLDTEHTGSCPYNISLGKPLSHYPIIQTALTLLELASTRNFIDRNHLILLLLSPFWSLQKTEWIERDAFIDFLQNEFSPLSPIENYRNYLTSPTKSQYHLDLRSLFQNNLRHATQASPSHWVSVAKNTLITTGWIAQPLNSEHYQSVQKFIQAMDNMALMDILNCKLSFQEWLGYLHRQCEKIIFQEEQKSDVSIEVLGLLEAAGERFDEIWISGLGDKVFPGSPNPNPLLPLSLQHNLPHSSHEIEWTFAQQTLQALIEIAPIVHCSHSANLDGRACLPSPLIIHYPLTDSILPSPPLISVPQNLVPLQIILEKAPSFTHLETEKKYSPKLLQLQNQCGLLTFFVERLKATPLETRNEHFSAADHGQILHLTLEQYHLSLQEQGQSSFSSQLLSESIHKALQKHMQRRGHWFFPEHIKNWAFQRTKTWLESWLSFEEQTLPHQTRVTQYIEYSIQLALGPLLFTGRIDRIDLLKEQDGLLLIDYKSSAQNQLSDWYKNPAAHPQMPFYALAIFSHSERVLLGLAFGILKPSQHKWQGISLHEKLHTSPLALELLHSPEQTSHFKASAEPPTWDVLINFWKDVFEETVQRFMQGDLTVDLEQFTEMNDPEYLLLRLPEKKQNAYATTH